MKPCPFCGSDRIVKGERYFAMCINCGATGPERASENTPERKWKGDWDFRPNCEECRLLKEQLRVADVAFNFQMGEKVELEKRLAIAEGGLDAAYLLGFHKRDDEFSELAKDKERLDWLQSQTKGYGTGWLCRDSTTGRGMRLHETSTIGAFQDVRQAIDEAMKGGSDA